MAMSDRIEAFIIELLKNEERSGLEIGRNELAGIFNCVPSQINYVIKTRFNPEKGYIVESRRGGGGYVRIRRIERDEYGDLSGILENIKNGVTEQKAAGIIDYFYETGRINKIQKDIISSACLDGVLGDEDKIRGKILTNILIKL